MKQKAQRTTKQRQSIESAILNAGRPLSPQEILLIAQQKVGSLGIATIYRTLKILQESGVVKAVTLSGEDFSRYEPLESVNQHHHHFLCTQCTRAFDVHGCEENFKKMLPEGFKILNHEITLYGYCKDCAKKRTHNN